MARKITPKTFEEAVSRLDEITQTMQGGVLPLEDSLALYQEGVALIRFCQEKLAKVEHALQVLDNEQLKDFELDAE